MGQVHSALTLPVAQQQAAYLQAGLELRKRQMDLQARKYRALQQQHPPGWIPDSQLAPEARHGGLVRNLPSDAAMNALIVAQHLQAMGHSRRYRPWGYNQRLRGAVGNLAPNIAPHSDIARGA